MPANEASAVGRTTPATVRRVRTRFAPSPTGILHLGALRTALFSYLLARHYQGDFILRIEDTDQNRVILGGLQSIIESLWGMGIEYDEGPDKSSLAELSAEYGPVASVLVPDSGGPYGPYFQSQRLPRYRQILDQLLGEGKAYYAFETKEELDAERAAAEAAKRPYRYRSSFRDGDLDDARARVASGEPHVVRFKMPLSGTIRTTDAIRGDIVWEADTQDDFVVLKGDGYPPYHLAAMVDDHDMEISHVLRGDDWLSSFPKHIALFEALGWEPPIFVHTPNVLGKDGKKLSKRHGAKGVDEFLSEGYLPEALTNFLALVGWSPGDNTEILSETELIARFDIGGISSSPAVFDIDKLNWMNGMYIRSLAPDDLAERTLPFLVKAELLPASASPAERAYAKSVVVLEQERMRRLDDAPALTDFFFSLLPEYDEKSVAKWLRREGVPGYLEAVAQTLNDAFPWSATNIEALVRGVGASHGREKGEMTHPIRVAVSGREIGPSLFDMLEVLGRDRALRRLTRALELSRG